ncbi:MAG TPA: sulfatase-like hydrolase/transferase, partial [Sphingobacteriaceae bacterium]|nr:sulfatase-like hydrolase/transferase [Sphingobacteriaceae bacterium]
MKKTVSTLALALLLLNIYAQKNSTQPVNILFVIADDWSFPHASFLGDNSVKTPNIDKLSKKGIVFNNSYCATPSCTPSRASILTGRY